jgi:hypothetical protein
LVGDQQLSVVERFLKYCLTGRGLLMEAATVEAGQGWCDLEVKADGAILLWASI